MVVVLPRSAYSIVRVAKDIARVNNWKCITGSYNPLMISEPVLLVGNPDGAFNILARCHAHNRQVWYLTTEGRVLNPELVRIANTVKPYIVANSKYTKAKLEESGLWVDEIIPHGTRYEPLKHVPRKNIKYLYVAGYLKRKYPPESRKVIEHVSGEAVFVTTFNNPYIPYMKHVIVSVYDSKNSWFKYGEKHGICGEEVLKILYRSAMFYLNLSTTEGFGLTILEAMSFGCIPIVLNVQPFNEFVSSECGYFYPHNGEIEEEPFGVHMIEHRHYNAEDVIELLNKIKYDENRAVKCLENAKKYTVKIYVKFREFFK